MTNQPNFSTAAEEGTRPVDTAETVSAGETIHGEAHRVPFLTAEQRRILKRFLSRVAACLLPFFCTLLFSRAPLLYGTQPLGLSFLCAVGHGSRRESRGTAVFLSAAVGFLAAALLGVYEAGSALYWGAFLLAVGIRYAVGRFLSDHRGQPSHPGFGAARGRGKPYAADAADAFSAAEEDGCGTGTAPRIRAVSRIAGVLFPDACFSADLGMRVGISVVCACPLAAGFLLSADTAVRGMLTAAFFLCSIPAFTWLFSGITEGIACTPGHREAGIAALCFSLTAASGSAVILGFSVRMLAAHAITLFVALKCGYLRGTICGLICGFACDALYAPAYALIGAVMGVLRGLYLAPAVVLSLCAGAAYAIYVGEFAAIRAVVPEMIAVSAVSYPMMRYLPDLYQKNAVLRRTAAWLARCTDPYLQPISVPRETEHAAAGVHTAEDAPSDLPRTRITPEELGMPGLAQQLDTLSGILRGLSTTFYHLSDRQKKPGLFEVRAMCEGIAEGFCTGCAKHDACWETDFSKTADAMGRITLAMYRRGRVASDGKSEGGMGTEAFSPLDRTCPHLAAMLAEMNDAAATLYEEKQKNDKTEVTAGDYEGMAKLLRAAAEDAARAGERDEALSRRLSRVIQKMGFSAEDISVYGVRRQTIIAHGVRMGDDSRGRRQDPLSHNPGLYGAEELREAFSCVAGVRYRPPVYSFGGNGGGVTMTLHAEPKFAMAGGCWGEKKAGEEITGDVLTMFSNRSDYYYALLCDGMGSGREASVTAQIASLFLEKLLSVSCAKGAALNLLNGYLRARSGECSATVDLCEIDMVTGDAHFVKCGAAASYLIRDDSMFRIASQTMPVGILREVSSEETAFSLCDGDTLLFFSDGVCGECEDAAWIPATLEAAKEDYAKAEARAKTRARTVDMDGTPSKTETEEKCPARCDYLARALGEAAKKRVGRADDMTVIYLEVKSLQSA